MTTRAHAAADQLVRLTRLIARSEPVPAGPDPAAPPAHRPRTGHLPPPGPRRLRRPPRRVTPAPPPGHPRPPRRPPPRLRHGPDRAPAGRTARAADRAGPHPGLGSGPVRQSAPGRRG